MTNTHLGRRAATPQAARGRFNRQLRYQSPHPLEPLVQAPAPRMRLMWDHCATGLWVGSRPLSFEEVSNWVNAGLWAQIQEWFSKMDRAQNDEKLVGQEFFKRLMALDAEGIQLAQHLVRAFQGVSARGKPVQIDYWCESASLVGKSKAQVRIWHARPFRAGLEQYKQADYFVADVLSEIEGYARNQSQAAVLNANTER